MSVGFRCKAEPPTALLFWPEPVSVFGSLVVTVPATVHTYVGRFIQPVLSTAWTLAVAVSVSRRASASGRWRRLSRRLLTRPLPISPASVGYCGRNRRFSSCFHVEQSLQSHFLSHSHANHRPRGASENKHWRSFSITNASQISNEGKFIYSD